MRVRRVGKRALVLALLATVCPWHPTLAQSPQSTPQPAQIDRNGTLILIRSALIALQQANETGNYTVLRDLGAPSFREANSAARLGEIFANLRGQKLDLAGILVLDPQLTLLPQIENNGMMHMTGVFPSVPVQINFDLAFAPVNGRWRLFGIAVGVGSSSPAAPSTPPPQPPAAPPPKPPKATKGTTKAKSNTPKSSKQTTPEPKKEPQGSGGATLGDGN